MEESTIPSIFKTTLTLPPNSSYTFKFRNGYFPNSWEGGWEILDDDCSVGDHNDRLLTIFDVDTVLTPICFGDCLTCE